MKRHILVPVDGSDPSDAAVRFASEQFPDARLTILHVVSPTEGIVGDGDVGYVDQGTLDAAINRGEDVCERAREIVREVTGDADDVETIVQIGRAPTSIIEFTEDAGVDQIVMGSRGNSGIQRLLLGSVAETIVRRASVPVTIVR